MLVACLETDILNQAVVAKLLHDHILYDYPNADARHLSNEPLQIPAPAITGAPGER
jgi:hypothetical protein